MPQALNHRASKCTANKVGSSFSLLSFATFLFMALVTLAEHPEFLWRRRIPFRVYLQIVVIFFVVNVSNNRVLGFDLPFPLIIVFRSSTLIANVLLTWLLQNRTFSLGRVLSVLLRAAVLDGSDLSDQSPLLSLAMPGQTLSFTFGVLVLSASSFASAYMGIVQERVFMRYGKHPEEMMFVVHFLSLPLFAFVANEIRSDFAEYVEKSLPVDLFIAKVPNNFLSLAAILILQLICIRSVYRLAAETTSLQNEFGMGHAIATGCVLLGSFAFYDGFTRFALSLLAFSIFGGTGSRRAEKTRVKNEGGVTEQQNAISERQPDFFKNPISTINRTMSEVSGGCQPPKKRKIQTIFLGAFNMPQSTSTSIDIKKNGTPPEASLVSDSTQPSPSSSFTSPRNAPLSPSRTSPSGRAGEKFSHEMDEQIAQKCPNLSTSKANCSFEGSSSHNGSATTYEKNGEEQQRLPPLPELNLESTSKLREVPQMCHLQNIAKLELPVPQPQKELELRLKLGFDAQIDRIIVQNSLSNKRTLKSARIIAKFGRETKWCHTVPSPALLIKSNRFWTVLFLEDKTFIVLHSQSGRVSCSLRNQSALALLELRDNFCLAVSTETVAQVWDLQRSRSIFRTSIRSLFGYTTESPRIVHTYVSAKGLPAIVLSSGDAFVYSLPLQSWLSFLVDHELIASKLCSMQLVAKTLPDGLIAALLRASKTEKPSGFVPQRAEMSAAKEESELEMLLRMTRELDSWEEYRFLTAIYAQLLLSRGKCSKLVEFLEELRSLSQTQSELPFSKIAADLSPLIVKEGGIDAERLLSFVNRGQRQVSQILLRTRCSAGVYPSNCAVNSQCARHQTARFPANKKRANRPIVVPLNLVVLWLCREKFLFSFKNTFIIAALTRCFVPELRGLPVDVPTPSREHRRAMPSPAVADPPDCPAVPFGVPAPLHLSNFAMPNSPNFDTSALTTKVGQNAAEEVPSIKDKATGEKGKDGTDTGETAGGAFCGIFCPRSFGRAIDKLLDFVMGSVHSSATASPSVSACSTPTRSREDQSPPKSLEGKIELIVELLERKPTQLAYGMRWAVQLLANATEEEKLEMLRAGVLSRICALITRYSNVEVTVPPESPKTQSLRVSRGSLEGIGREVEGMKTADEKTLIPGATKEGGRDQQRRGSDQPTETSKKRPGSAGSTRKKDGVGYGTGSTKSRWNIARTVEERALHDQHLIGLLSALIAFLWGDQLADRLSEWEMAHAHKGGDRRRSGTALLLEKMPEHLLDEAVTRQISASAVIPLLSNHLSNDSVLDVSQHMPFFQVLLELCAALAAIPALLPKLVLPQGEHGKSIAKELIPQFRDNLNNYPTLMRGISEADLTFMDFIRKINDYSEVIIRVARQFERQIPAEKRIKTSQSHRYFARVGVERMRRLRNLVPTSTGASSVNGAVQSQANGADLQTNVPFPLGQSSAASRGGFGASATVAVAARQRSATTAHRQKTATARRLSTLQLTELNEQSPSEQYREVLREMQLSTYRLLNDAGKPMYGFSFKRELRSVNPFSTTHKDRTKRIAKELASMHNSLPLNDSNAIFVCMDETRCDILKVLVTGPDDTPYENGLFEFDVFFPSNYPQQPPKCSFLTTGAGKVRFNPNLYNDGKICLSILGTWEGRPEEKWNPLCSLLQVLISIQGLIFVRHPYFNEPGFEKLQGTPKGDDLSRKYNLHIENATLNYAIYEQWKNGPPYFADVIRRHFWLKRHAVIRNSGHSLLPDVDGMADGVLSSQSLQRQTVRKLVEQFRDMENPLLADAEEPREGGGEA
uniref:UBC core domain-containing protein n=1 Tax=Globodera rostochiensis TaxID=31243 RepID=A0A914GQW2_GLORO